jgi:uncharacterized Zn-binding protein involved in type VI secretion
MMKKANPALGKPAAKQGDKVVALDTHILMVPSPGGPVPTPTPMPFSGDLTEDLSSDVFIANMPAAKKGSGANNVPPHVPAGGPFLRSPSNKATVKMGSQTVFINNQEVAVFGSTATTCSDPADAPNGTVIAQGTVFVGG